MEVAGLLAIVFTTLALAPGAVIVMELPDKLRLSREEYMFVQRTSRGCRFARWMVASATVTTLVLAILADDAGRWSALLAFVALLATQIVFFVDPCPVNWITQSATAVPNDWVRLRARWEISHAVAGLPQFVAIVCVA